MNFALHRAPRRNAGRFRMVAQAGAGVERPAARFGFAVREQSISRLVIFRASAHIALRRWMDGRTTWLCADQNCAPLTLFSPENVH
ncbi:MAG: hypothetical protein ACAH27_20160 [Xanthobacteraceae bacterium]